MIGIFKWLKNNAKIKRWIFIILVGVVSMCYGIARIIVNKTMQVQDIILTAVFFVVGFTLIVLGILFMQRRMLEILIEETDTRKSKNNVNSLIFNKKIYDQGPKVVVIGGGSGLNTVLRGLKNYTDNITAIVTVSDYGETPTDSRRALRVLPLDDIKESLVALSYDEKEMQELLNLRFDDSRLNGLAFGDIYFLAMNNIYGNFSKSIENSKSVLNITGKVMPVTLEPINICAELEDGTVVESKEKIPEVVSQTSKRISRIYINPTNTKPAPGVAEAIQEADAIIIGPGSLYTNVIPNLLIKGIAKAIKESNAMKVYVSNIMTEMGQTDEYTLSDHIKAIIDYVGEGIIDYCIYDTGEIVPEFIQKYNLKGADVVIADTSKSKSYGVKLIQRNMSKIDEESIIHDPDIIASTIIQLVCDELEFNDMENNSQYMKLSTQLKESKKEIRKQKRADKKFHKSGRRQFEPRGKNYISKFGEKYKERINTIKQSDKKTMNRGFDNIEKIDSFEIVDKIDNYESIGKTETNVEQKEN